MNAQSIKIIEAARELLKTAGYFVDNLWHTDDVHFICEECKGKRFKEEILEV